MCIIIVLTNVDLDESEVIVELGAIGRDLNLLHINRFITAMNSDSSLCKRSHSRRLQMYIATECDFISSFFF